MDILTYFNQLLPVLENDDSLYCISAWNDQVITLMSDPALQLKGRWKEKGRKVWVVGGGVGREGGDGREKGRCRAEQREEERGERTGGGETDKGWN